MINLKKLTLSLQKYKHALLVLSVGLGLMLLPTPSRNPSSTPAETVAAVAVTEMTLENRLEAILGQIHGAGEVRVLLTEQSGSQTLYHSDTESSEGNGTASLRSNTVITEDGDHAELPLIARVDPPVYQGAVIVCRGADNPSVKLALVEAVRCATGLGADQITVIKMK